MNKASSGISKANESVKAHVTTAQTKAPQGVFEWAKSKVNFQHGCEHKCSYCFAANLAFRFGRSTPESWEHPEVRHVQKSFRKRDGKVMFPTSHDIGEGNIEIAVQVLHGLLKAGNEVLIVSKPHLSCIKRLCKELEAYKSQILFRFTIGSIHDDVLKAWEPGAPKFGERLASLRYAYEHGYATSISAEPMLDLDISALILTVRPYVTDAIWLGRANRLRQIIAVNCPHDAKAKKMADALLNEQSDEYLRAIYKRYQNDPMIKFKDSIKKAAGLERPTEKGLDV